MESQAEGKRLLPHVNFRKLIIYTRFRRDHTTTDHIFVLHQTMHYYMNLNKKLYIAFVDFHKAFDKVWRNGLLTKLRLQSEVTLLNTIVIVY